MKTAKVTPWVECKDCGEYYCQVHRCHVHDSECACPWLEVWVEELDQTPYAPIKLEVVNAFLESEAVRKWIEENN